METAVERDPAAEEWRFIMKRKIMLFGLAVSLILGMSGCSLQPETNTLGSKTSASSEPESSANVLLKITPEPEVKKELIVGSVGLTKNFQPLYQKEENTADQMVCDLLFSSIFQRDADGSLQEDLGHIEAEEAVQEDGTVKMQYTITIEKGKTFSDGKKVTIDDVLFTYYVCLDPSYDGGLTLNELPISGLNSYYFDRTYLWDIQNSLEQKYRPEVIVKEDFINYLVESKLDGWFDGELPGDADGKGMSWEEYLNHQGYDGSEAANADEMLAILAECEYAYHASEYDPYSYYRKKEALAALEDGVAVEAATGIQKVDKYTCTVLLDQAGCQDMETLGLIPILPKHIYGKDAKKGNMDAVKALSKNPVGSGAYRLDLAEDQKITLKAILDEKDAAASSPADAEKTKLDLVILGLSEDQGETAVKSAAAMLEEQNLDLLATENTQEFYNKFKDQKEITLLGWNHSGYGYLGIQAKRVSDPMVRQGIMYLVQREKAVSYYGEGMAEILERPLDPTLYEYPEDAAAYYSYSKEKALEAFRAAGYVQTDGKLLREGRQLVIHAGVSSLEEHPGGTVLKALQKDLEELGAKLVIAELPYETLAGKVMEGELDLWFLAWENAEDCNLTDIFGSQGEQNFFGLASESVDGLLLQIAGTYDQEERKKLVKEELDLIMEQAVCLPLYNRKDLLVLRTNVLDENSLVLPRYHNWKFLGDLRLESAAQN